MMWIWLSLGAFMGFVLFVDLVWNAETRPEKVKVNPENRYTTDDWI